MNTTVLQKRYRFFWITTYSVSAGLLFTVAYLLRLGTIETFGEHTPFVEQAFFTMGVIALVLLAKTVVGKLIDRLQHAEGERYNLHRVTRLVTVLVIGYIVITFKFKDTYTFLTGLGLLSLILGFALQAPIGSFIGWLYIIFRRPYQVGDRVQIGEHRGDVVEINYLDTMLEECSGGYLGNDRKSGRVIHFPNSTVLSDKVLNYTGPSEPFIWNETALQVAYTSDLEFVSECLLRVTWEDFAERYPRLASDLDEPAEAVNLSAASSRWAPEVYFRVNPRAWVEAVVSYPVEPTDTTGRRTRILRAVLPLLNAAPDKVQFPAGTQR